MDWSTLACYAVGAFIGCGLYDLGKHVWRKRK